MLDIVGAQRTCFMSTWAILTSESVSSEVKRVWSLILFWGNRAPSHKVTASSDHFHTLRKPLHLKCFSRGNQPGYSLACTLILGNPSLGEVPRDYWVCKLNLLSLWVVDTMFSIGSLGAVWSHILDQENAEDRTILKFMPWIFALFVQTHK